MIVDTSKMFLPNASESKLKVRRGDCWNQLRNVCICSDITHLSSKLSEFLEWDLDEIHSSLRIKTSLNNLFRVVEKEFNFIENYSKGNGEIFMACMIINHPGDFLMPTMRALGRSRQDIWLEGSPSILINRRYNVDFIMEHLCFTENILQKNLFVILQSVEMTALLWVYAIMNIYIGINIQWLTAKAHELGEYNWGMFLMVQVVYTYMMFVLKYRRTTENYLTNIYHEYIWRHWERYTRTQKLSWVFI